MRGPIGRGLRARRREPAQAAETPPGQESSAASACRRSVAPDMRPTTTPSGVEQERGRGAHDAEASHEIQVLDHVHLDV